MKNVGIHEVRVFGVIVLVGASFILYRSAFQQRDAVAGDGAFFANGIDVFVGFAFDVDLLDGDAKQLGEALFHGLFIRGEFGLLGDDDDVDIGDLPGGLAEAFHGGFEEFGGIDAFEFGVGVGEEFADVGEAGSAGEGVDEGVEDDIGIGMAGETVGVGDGDVGEDERAARFGAVEVVADADAK